MNENLMNLILIMLLTDVIILAVYVISPIIGEKAGFRWRKILWIVLSVRLLIPVHLIQSVLTLPVYTVPLKWMVSEHSPAKEEKDSVNKDMEITDQNLSDGRFWNNEAGTEARIIGNSIGKSDKTYVSRTVSEWFYIIWGIGVVIFLILRICQFFIVKRFIRDTAKECSNTYIQERIPELCGKYGLQMIPEVLISKKIHSPMLWGYQVPKMILPAKNYSIDEIELILSHELIHYKNKDLWYKLFLMLVCDLYWFNPVLRIMQSAANRDMEYLCDEAVIREKSLTDKKTYANVILQGVTTRKQKHIAFSTHFIEKETSVEERIENIFTNKKKWKGRISFGFFVLLVIGSCFLRVSVKSEAAYNMQADHSMAIAGCWYPSEKSVMEVRNVALEGMGKKDIETLRGFVIQMNMYWENKFLWQEAEKELSDPESEQWDGVDRMIASIEKINRSVQNQAFKNDLTRLAELIRQAEETHDVNYVVEMYHMLHDMDYYLFRYGPRAYGDEVRDRSMLETYYGVLEVYEIFN